MEKIRFALMGCGRISRKHVAAIRDIKNAELVAVCDPNLSRAKKLAEEFNISCFF